VKTFAEAFDTVVIATKRDAPPEQHLEALIRAAAIGEKYAHLATEMAQHPHVHQTIAGVLCGSSSLFDACRMALQLGVQIGIEMERDDSRERQLVDSTIKKPKPEGYSGI